MHLIPLLTVVIALSDVRESYAVSDNDKVRSKSFLRRSLQDSSCTDNAFPFLAPSGKFRTCEEVSINPDGFCNVGVVEDNCPVSCKVCPLCTQSEEKIFMGTDHGMQYCSFASQNSEVCQRKSVNEKCPLACDSCCEDQPGLIPLTSEEGSVECNTFKQDEYRKFCTWARISKSCPSACGQCSSPTCSDSKYSVLLKGDITACSADLVRTQY